MTVNLIHFTGQGTADEKYYAARLLAYTKNTRLNLTPDGFHTFELMSGEALECELNYMSSSIASSWEFVDVVFAINDVSRACAQQITRTRTASFAMQSQRVTNMSEVGFHIPDSIPPAAKTYYKLTLENALNKYKSMVEVGVSLEDARGVLPMNTYCNLLAKYNLRNWINLVRSRSSLRVQSEYREVIEGMKAEVLRVWPWAVTFIEPKDAKAIAMIEALAVTLAPEQKVTLAKATDLLKKETA